MACDIFGNCHQVNDLSLFSQETPKVVETEDGTLYDCDDPAHQARCEIAYGWQVAATGALIAAGTSGAAGAQQTDDGVAQGGGGGGPSPAQPPPEPEPAPPPGDDDDGPVPPGSETPTEPTSPHSGGDPVLTVSGELFDRIIDIRSGASGLELEFVRSYRSQAVFASHLGRNWDHTFEERIVTIDNNHVDYSFPLWCYLMLPDNTCVYHYRGDGGGDLYMLDLTREGVVFVPTAGSTGIIKAVLQTYDGGSDQAFFYAHRDRSGIVTEFDPRGRAIRKIDSAGREALYEYDGDGALKRVVDSRGHGFEFEYGLWGLLVAVNEIDASGSGAGRRVEYCYDLAVNPSFGDLHDDFAALEEKFGLVGPNAVKGCYRIVPALPSFEEAIGVILCAEASTDRASFDACMASDFEATAAAIGSGLPLNLDDYRDVFANKVQRASAFLNEVRILPAGHASAEFADCVGAGVDAQVDRYAYSDIMLSRDFLYDYVRALPPHVLRKRSSELGTVGTCAVHERPYATFRLIKELDALRGRMTRVERRLNAAELAANGVPATNTTAVGCADATCGDYWQVTLEVGYDWNPASKSFGRVDAQRFGGGVDAASPWTCDTTVPPDGEHPFVTAMPRTEFDYLTPGIFPKALAQMVGDEQAEARAAFTAINAAAALAASDGSPFATFYYGVGGCDDIAYDNPAFRTDVLGKASTDQDFLALLESIRLSRDVAARRICSIVRFEDRNGQGRFMAFNFMGRTIVEVTGEGSSQHVVLARYNGDGNLVEEWDQPPILQRGIYPAADFGAGPRLVLTRDDANNPNPLSRANVLVSELFGSASGASGMTAFAGAPVQVTNQYLRTEVIYEPLTNSAAQVTVSDDDPSDGVGSPNLPRVTTNVFEYQLEQHTFDDAMAQYEWWQLRPDASTVFASMAAIDVLPSYEVLPRLPAYPPHARPLLSGVIAPALFSDASGAAVRPAVAYRTNAHGQVIEVRDSAGQTVRYDYAGVEDAQSYDPLAVQVEPKFTPGLAAPRRDAHDGGPMISVTQHTDLSASAPGFSDVAPGVEAATTYHVREAPYGRRSGIESPSGAISKFYYDGHGRLDRIETPDGGVEQRAFDGAGRVVRRTLIGAGVDTISEQIYRDAAGEVVASVVDTQYLGRRPLSTQIADRAANGSANVELTTVERDGEGRPTLVVSPELRGVAMTYHPWAGVERVEGRDEVTSPATVLHVSTTSYDHFGRPTRSSVLGGGESLETERAFDGLGQLVAEREPNGTAAVVARNWTGEVIATRELDTSGVVLSRVEIERDPAGLVRSVTRAWLADASVSGTEKSVTSAVQRDDLGRVICAASPDGAERRLTYTSDGQVAHAVVANHVTTVPCSGTSGELLSERYARFSLRDSRARTRQIHAGGAFEAETDALLDWAGRPTTVTELRDGVSTSQTFTYDAFGRTHERRDEWNALERYHYDSAGRLKHVDEHAQRGGVSSPDDLVTWYSYDGDGLLVELTDPVGAASSFGYDGLGRLVSQSLPGPSGSLMTRTLTYDALGRLDASTSGQLPSVLTDYSYLANTTLLSSRTTGAVAVGYGWSVANQLETVARMAAGHTVTTTRANDGLGRVLSEETRIAGLTWDAAYLVEMQYDGSAARLNTVRSSVTGYPILRGFDELTVHPQYQGALLAGVDGRRTGTTQAVVGLDLGYTGAAPTLRTVAAGGTGWLTHEIELDGFGRASALTWYLGDVLGAELGGEQRYYGKDHRQVANVLFWRGSTTSADHGRLRVAAYDGLGRLVGLRHAYDINQPNALEDTQQWLSALDSSSLVTQLQSSDPNSVRTSSTGIGGAWSTFERSRLGTPEIERVDGVIEWSASLIGERGISDVTSPLTSGTATLGWVASRGLLERAGVLDLVWTEDELLDSVAHVGSAGRSESYVYDGFGRIVRTIRDGEVLDRVYAGVEVLREVARCGERVWWPSGALDRPLAYSLEIDGSCSQTELDATFDLFGLKATNLTSEMQQPDGQLFGVLQDLHGDVVGVVDRAGTLLETWEYDVHGSRTLRDPVSGAVVASSVLGAPVVSGWGNPLGYTGRPLSSVSGLYDMRARHYEPHLRVWTAPDPLGYVDSFDLWQYTAADPLNRVDPFGLDDSYEGDGDFEAETGLLVHGLYNWPFDMSVSNIATHILLEAGNAVVRVRPYEGSHGPDRFVTEYGAAPDISLAHDFLDHYMGGSGSEVVLTQTTVEELLPIGPDLTQATGSVSETEFSRLERELGPLANHQDDADGLPRVALDQVIEQLQKKSETSGNVERVEVSVRLSVVEKAPGFAVGNFTLIVSGAFEAFGNRWRFTGKASMYDLNNFNRSSHRSAAAELFTAWGRQLDGEPFDVTSKPAPVNAGDESERRLVWGDGAGRNPLKP